MCRSGSRSWLSGRPANARSASASHRATICATGAAGGLAVQLAQARTNRAIGTRRISPRNQRTTARSIGSGPSVLNTCSISEPRSEELTPHRLGDLNCGRCVAGGPQANRAADPVEAGRPARSSSCTWTDFARLKLRRHGYDRAGSTGGQAPVPVLRCGRCLPSVDGWHHREDWKRTSTLSFATRGGHPTLDHHFRPTQALNRRFRLENLQ